jgi:membrane fusion protein (multidrug efflux system)
MASKVLYTVVAVVGIAAASGAAWWYQNKPSTGGAGPSSAGGSPGAAAPQTGASAAAPARPAAVEVARVEVMRLTDDTQAVGSLRSRQGVMLRPEVSGRITQLNFRDGERVRKGQLLVQFDDQLPAAQLKQSLAEQSIAAANHKRNQELLAQKFVSQRSVEESAANLEVAQAKVALAQATLERLKVKAPFDGIAGIRLVNQGDYLKDGADIVNIEDIDAVYVDFRLPERFQSKVRKGQRAQIDLDALPGRKFTAVIQAVDPLLDTGGRSVGVRACIDNRQLHLRPGMFARVTPVFGERENAKVVPEEAVVPQGQKAYVIKVVDGTDKDSNGAVAAGRADRAGELYQAVGARVPEDRRTGGHRQHPAGRRVVRGDRVAGDQAAGGLHRRHRRRGHHHLDLARRAEPDHGALQAGEGPRHRRGRGARPVSRVRGRCPMPSTSRSSPRSRPTPRPVIWLAYTSETMSPLELTDLVNRIVKPRLQTVPGVADVQIGGDRKYAMRVWLDPDKLAAYRLTVQDVEDACGAEPGGAGRTHREPAARVQRHRAHRPEHRGAVRRHRAQECQRLYTVRLRDVGRVQEARQ